MYYKKNLHFALVVFGLNFVLLVFTSFSVSIKFWLHNCSNAFDSKKIELVADLIVKVELIPLYEVRPLKKFSLRHKIYFA